MTHQATARIDDDIPSTLNVEVVERRDTPGAWGVEAINLQGEGEIYMAVFSGPDAKTRAIEYAHMKYGDHVVRQ